MSVQEELIGSVTYKRSGLQSHEPNHERRTSCVIGLGAIGMVAAAALGRGSNDRLVLVGRSGQEPAIRDGGLRVTGILGDLSVGSQRFEFYTSINAIPADMKFERVMVFVKCYDVDTVAHELAQRRDLIGEQTSFHAFQNGWASHPPLLALAAPERIFVARVITGAHREGPNWTNVTVHQDDVLIGSVASAPPSLRSASELAHDLSAGGLPARETNDISRFIWAKVIYDACVNALGALHRATPAELSANPDIGLELECLLEETFSVVKRSGYTTGFGTLEAYREYFFTKLIPTTAGHRSSMLQDLERANARTEVDWINGAVARLARENGIFAGLNELVTKRIHHRESQRVRSKPVQREASLKIGSNRAVSEPAFAGVEGQAGRTA